MKKIYQNPTTEVMHIELHQMMAVSPATEEIGFGEGKVSASGAESRRGSLWDDED